MMTSQVPPPRPPGIAPRPLPPLSGTLSEAFRGRRVHLLGIGGAGMSALVPLLQVAGARVSGCDIAENAATKRLQDAGIEVSLGHSPEHVADADMLIHSSAVPASHAELRQARQLGRAVWSRAACLAELMRGHRTIAVAGSHGKTTTTWLCAHLLVSAGRDPLVMVGGAIEALGGSGTRIGRERLFVAEVDESDGGFAHVDPSIAVVTNLEAEHLRHYGSFAGLVDAFAGWLARVPVDGVCLVPAIGLPDGVLTQIKAPVVTCGIENGRWAAHDLTPDAEGTTFTLVVDGQTRGRARVPLPGRHMVEDAVLALAAAEYAGATLDLEDLTTCQRVRRRFTVHGHADGVRVVEDYAHHPTEIAATISAAAQAGKPVHVLFQPHRWTRTADCFQDYLTCFGEADAVAIMPIYAAGEEPIAGVSGRDLAEAVARHHRHPDLVQYAPNANAGMAWMAAHAVPGATCLVLGAGDVGRLAPELLTVLT